MGRLSKKAVHVIAERQFQAKGHAARTAAHAARQIDKQRMIGIHHRPCSLSCVFRRCPATA
jgi:hypothetical protein